jgi:anti-sigma B factor antagonist
MTQMDLTFETRSEGDWTVLAVGGELDLHTSASLSDRLLELGSAASSRVAVDMAQVGFMDSSGLGVLVAALKRMQENQGELALVGVSGSPLKVLAITGLDKVIPNYASVADLPGA